MRFFRWLACLLTGHLKPITRGLYRCPRCWKPTRDSDDWGPADKPKPRTRRFRNVHGRERRSGPPWRGVDRRKPPRG